MQLKWKIKRFEALTIAELYTILQLRSEVFVVEQNCVYQDIDGKDQKAIHVIGKIEDEIMAYARLFQPGDYFEEAAIGRVVVNPEFRGKNLGHLLMEVSIREIEFHFKTSKITISAQLYLKQFYESHGFVQIGEYYLEDGIPHIRMKKE